MRRLAVVALALALGACGDDATDVASTASTTSTTDIAESLPFETTTVTTTTASPATSPPTTAAPTTAAPTTVATRPPTTAPPTTAAPAPAQSCHPSYQGACLPPDASDVDCAGGSGNGPVYTGRVTVVGPDVYDLDRDGDGVGCQNS